MRFITPIAASIGKNPDLPQKNGQGFQKFKEEPPPDATPSPSVDNPIEKPQPALTLVANPVPKPTPEPGKAESTLAYLQLLNLVQDKNKTSKLQFVRVYQFNLRNQKRRLSKGAMLNTLV